MSWLANMQAAVDGHTNTLAPQASQEPVERMSSRLRESIDGTEKLCARCDEWWPADLEFFFADKGGLKGLLYCCKACYEERKAALAAAKGVPNRRRSIEPTSKGVVA